VTTYEEWRVTGRLADRAEGSPYEFTWRKSAYADPEGEARRFINDAAELMFWTDGPHLHRRTVTVTDWQEAEA
jgi:hypothetical protein